MHIVRQTAHILSLLLGNHRTRPHDGILVCLGFIIASAVLTALFAIPTGIEHAIGNTGQRDIAIVVAGDAPYEAKSELTPEQIAILSQFPQVARNQDGRPFTAPQFVANTKLIRLDGQPATVVVRGITADIWELLAPETLPMHARLQEGSRQLLASKALAAQFAVLRQADIRLQGREWQLAGFLDAGGNLWESELWADFSALQAAYNRPGMASSLWLKLTSPEALHDLQARIRADRRLDGIKVQDQVSYYQHRVGNIVHFTRAMSIGVSVLLGLAACLVISGMLGIVLHHRRQQMATLRTLGFERDAIALASLMELLILGGGAALVTAGLAWCWLDGVSFGAANFEQAVYARFVIDAGVVLKVLDVSLLIGLVSAALPLRRALRGRALAALQG